MPCYTTGSAEGDARLSASEARAEATRAVELLCRACAIIEQRVCKLKDGGPLMAELAAWWMYHQEVDAKRLKKERRERQRKINGEELRKSAMDKLTEEEKIELFGGKP